MKSTKFQLLLLLAMFAMSTFAQQPTQVAVTPRMAVNFVKQSYTGCNYWYSYGKVAHVINGACGCHVDSTIYQDNPWLVSADSLWVVFVDQKPMSNWEHACKFVYVPTYVTDTISLQSFTIEGNCPPMSNLIVLSPWGENGEGIRLVESTVDFSEFDSSASVEESEACPPFEPSDPFYRGTEEGNKTVAVLVDCVPNAENNFVYYYNDMQYLFDVLTQKYGVPWYSTYTFMLDTLRLNGTEYIKMPTNSFSTTDYERSYGELTSRRNFISCLRDLQYLGPEDHLFLFFDGHGGYDEVSQHYYVNMPDGYFFDYELKELLDSISSKYQTIVMENCHSGGFIPTLAAPGRTIITACDANEKSGPFVFDYSDLFSSMKNHYNIFAHLWTSALNGKRLDYEIDANRCYIENTNNRPVNADFDGNGRVTLEESFISASQNAAEYLAKADSLGFGDFINNEHAQYSSSPATVGEDLAFNHIPDSVALFVRDNVSDFGKESNTTTSTYWDSPDMWTSVSNSLSEVDLENLGLVEESFSSRNTNLYTYVRITNRGICDYDGHGKFLHLMWSSAALNQSPQVWMGLDSTIAGGEIPPVEITQSIPVGESRVVTVPWRMPDAIYNQGMASCSDFCFSLLTHISDTTALEINEISDSTDMTTTPVLKYRDMAQKGFQFSNPNGGSLDSGAQLLSFSVAPSGSNGENLTVTVVDDSNNTYSIVDNSEIELATDSVSGSTSLEIDANKAQNVILNRKSVNSSSLSGLDGGKIHAVLTDANHRVIGGAAIVCVEDTICSDSNNLREIKIKSADVYANSAIRVVTTQCVSSGVSVLVTSVQSPVYKKDVTMKKDTDNVSIAISDLPAGTYAITLMKDGVVTDSTQIIILQ